MSLLALAIVLAGAAWFGWQFYKNEVRRYRGVRQCDCHPRRPRGDRTFPVKGPPWRA